MQNVVEITLHTRGEHFLHAVGKADTWQSAMSAAVAKVLHQTEKVKGVWHERKRRGPAARSVKTPRKTRTATARKTAPVAAAATSGEPPRRTRAKKRR
jgi:hypothetical protein